MAGLVLLLISAIIGAGFATGAELVAFFGDTGMPPIVVAVMVAGCLFGISCLLIYFEQKQSKFTRHIFTAIYLASFVVMTAGLRHIAGGLVTALSLGFCVIVVFCGFKWMLFINKYLMFFVLGILLFASITNLTPADVQPNESPRVFRAIGMAILYAGMNGCILQRVLLKLREEHSKKRVLVACGIAFLIIAVLVALVLTAITSQGTVGAMPILELSNNYFTRAAVFFCILTSMMILLYNSVQRTSRGYSSVAFAVVCSLVAFFLSFFGFKNILGWVYPLIGGFMILYCFCLLLLRCPFRKDSLVVHDTIDGLQIVQDK